MQQMLLKVVTILAMANFLAPVTALASLVSEAESTFEAIQTLPRINNNGETSQPPLLPLTLGESICQNCSSPEESYDHIIEELSISIQGRKDVDLCASSGLVPASIGSGYSMDCPLLRWDYFDEIHLQSGFPLYLRTVNPDILVAPSGWRSVETELDRLDQLGQDLVIPAGEVLFMASAKGAFDYSPTALVFLSGGGSLPEIDELEVSEHFLIPAPFLPVIVQWRPVSISSSSSPTIIEFRINLRETWLSTLPSEDPYLRDALSQYQCWKKLEEGIEVRVDYGNREKTAIVSLDCGEKMAIEFKFR